MSEAINKIIKFKSLNIEVSDGKAKIVSFGGKRNFPVVKDGVPLSDVVLSSEVIKDENGYIVKDGIEKNQLRYVSHEINGDTLIVTERSDRLEVVTSFFAYKTCNAIAVEKTLKNISRKEQKLESAATLALRGVGTNIDDADKTFFYKFTQSHHAECQPRKISLYDFGFFRSYSVMKKRLFFSNVGSWSTKEQLPQGIVENEQTGEFLMFQIESNYNWEYSLSVSGEDFVLSLYGYASPSHRFVKVLSFGESYRTARVAFCFGNGLNDVIKQMTLYRRVIAGTCAADENLPVIFNEYMHLSWDNPFEIKTRKYAKAVAEAGADYYVIDCGWHDEMQDGVWVYPYMGRWKENKKNFPHGVRATTDYIRSLGMKAGLWIEPEIVGVKCSEMLDFYDDDCFLMRNGERICVCDKFILNFKSEKVKKYLSETIRRMIKEYGADYIKLDYNVDSGFVDGDFDEERIAYLAWVDLLKKEFPETLFETCSSGGMRMDYETLKHFSIVSTSDQIRDFLYPYIAGNVLSAVLPEQAAVWSYPVSKIDCVLDKETVQKEISDEKIVLNMVNAMLGRLHLSSDLSLLSKRQFSLVKEGVDVIKEINKIKRMATPYFPLGFTDFSKSTVACGLTFDNVLYLAVWGLRGNVSAVIPIENAKNVKVVYPTEPKTNFTFSDKELTVNFTETNCARLFKITF